jgi:hypothetical protein
MHGEKGKVVFVEAFFDVGFMRGVFGGVLGLKMDEEK